MQIAKDWNKWEWIPDLLPLSQCFPAHLAGNQKISDLLFTQWLVLFSRKVESKYFKESLFNYKVSLFLCLHSDFNRVLKEDYEWGSIIRWKEH